MSDMIKVILPGNNGQYQITSYSLYLQQNATKMKRVFKSIVILLLAVVYIAASMGFSVHSHYCCGKKVSTTFWEKKNKCACGKTGKPKRCCRDEVTTFKIQDNHKNTTASFAHKSVPEIFSHTFLRAFQSVVSTEPVFENTYHNTIPPLIGDVPLFLRHRLLLI